MNQTSGPTPAAAAPQAPDSSQPADAGAGDAGAGPAGASAAEPPGFGARGRARRRTRFLRKARELAYRDLGGLVFNLHRFGQRNDALVLRKLAMLTQIDAELRALESALGERQTVTVLREPGITACPRCAAIHGGEDRFCPNCGLSLGRHVDLPIAGAPTPPAVATASTTEPISNVPEPASADAAAGAQPRPAAATSPAPGVPTSPAPVTPPAGASAPHETPPPSLPTGGRASRPPGRPERPLPSGDGQQTEILRPLESDK